MKFDFQFDFKRKNKNVLYPKTSNSAAFSSNENKKQIQFYLTVYF